ncbi:UNVERIFIED_CONTAM: hypothetical protein FKN15_010946 [Acipenser sinensis]
MQRSRAQTNSRVQPSKPPHKTNTNSNMLLFFKRRWLLAALNKPTAPKITQNFQSRQKHRLG